VTTLVAVAAALLLAARRGPDRLWGGAVV